MGMGKKVEMVSYFGSILRVQLRNLRTFFAKTYILMPFVSQQY